MKWENRQRALGERDFRLELPDEDVQELGWRHPAYRLNI
jgi:hypothetical protein